MYLFQSTPSLRKATKGYRPERLELEFQSTPSLRKATRKTGAPGSFFEFQSTPSLRKATLSHGTFLTSARISIHTFLAEGDSCCTILDSR